MVHIVHRLSLLLSMHGLGSNQAITKGEEVFAAFKPTCGKDGMAEFQGALEQAWVAVTTAKECLARASSILSENIVAHCLKIFVDGSSAGEDQKEKVKRRGLLTAQMSKVSHGLHGQCESSLHPVLVESAKFHLIKKPAV